jgi:hypothetical protein
MKVDLTEQGKPCAQCPWTSSDPRDKSAIDAHKARAAAEAGQWFCCHVNLGTCYGALAVSKRAAKETQ